jgi:transposase
MKAIAASAGASKFEVVKQSELHRLVVVPKRWIVERTLAWVSRDQRPSRDNQRHTRKAAAFVRFAMVRIIPMCRAKFTARRIHTSRKGS